LVGSFLQGTNLGNNYSISQGIDEFVFPSNKDSTNVYNFSNCCLFAHKIGNVEAVDRLPILKKKYLEKRHLHREHW